MSVQTRRPSPTEAGLTPLMRQYLSAKAANEGSVLLFRMGDFWETFWEDAVLLAKVTGITLTTRGSEKGEPVPLAGVPLSSLERTVSKLVAAGHRVAICDQVEDPKQAKGIVKREVVEVISAGTATFPGLLDERADRYLVSLWPDAEAGRVGIVRCDVTTGEFVGGELMLDALADELQRLRPAEVLVPARKLPAAVERAVAALEVAVEKRPADRWAPAEDAERRLREGPGIAPPAGESPLFLPLAVVAASALVDYLADLSKAEGRELDPLTFEAGEGTLILDDISLRNLEILRPLREGATGSTLLSVMDRTRTPMGARLLKRWLARPLLAPERVAARQDAVADLIADRDFAGRLAERLDRMGDVARLAMRVAAGRAHGRDLVGLAESLADLPELKTELRARKPALFSRLIEDLGDFTAEVDTIREAIAEEPPVSIKDGGVMRAGYSEELDHLRALTKSGKNWIAELQAAERERTGISNLKIGYNRVFGYYLEVTKGNKALVPADYERRQTLVNAERYVTPQLKERESEILGAEEKAKNLEYDLFVEVRERLAISCARIRRAAGAIATLDVLADFADLAVREAWVRPTVNDTDRLRIRGGRHPVVEAGLPAHEFVPNDVHLDGAGRQILLITGPNMAGKSTYLRQVALLVLLAQIGSWVPAEEAEIGVVDRVFTRVG
ncbi:MAG: DNA mismatch repair protein MutS, partial [Gemmatimonadetes bacterium]|nr:DNA mismatch repair protein MutS [Gemmatimonadota bacterium]